MELLQYVSNPWVRGVLVLMVFAGLDLMVGVSNDAVNFLNSSIGSKAAPRKVIFWIAAIGIFVGAAFSGGMMEIARKGVFNPEMFTFYDIMIVFFSVVMADVILLDVYNSLKLPTSTTVSVVFELLGAGLAIALIHLFSDDLTISAMGNFINASGTISIISGIFLSVGIAFISGWIVQMVVRYVFTFDYEKTLAYWGWVLGGFSISVISYFLIIKGLKNASWVPDVMMSWVQGHMWTTLGVLFLLGVCISLFIQYVLKKNILKFIVLLGTFALASAFAGNDLVNFIGVSVAGYQSIMLYLSSGADASMMMTGLADSVQTPQIFLFGAAFIMVGTLFWSKKARSVSETELGLTKHATGQEQFTPGKISRWIVKKTVKTHKKVIQWLPTSRQNQIFGRFVQLTHKSDPDVAFDLVRASVNLTLSAILIAVATNMKLPLSTTYVTFMVAMGTALADGARGRDSAVYRISGVLTIIGAWVMTAVVALTLTLLLAIFLWNVGLWGIGIVMIGVAYILYRSHTKEKKPSVSSEIAETLSAGGSLSEILLLHTTSVLPLFTPFLQRIVNGIVGDDDTILVPVHRDIDKMTKKTKLMKRNIHKIFSSLPDSVSSSGHTYVQGIEVLRKATIALSNIALESKEYVLNKHPDLIEEQHQELYSLQEKFEERLSRVQLLLDSGNLSALDNINKQADQLLDDIDKTKHAQFARIKSGQTGIRNTDLYVTILTEMYAIVVNLQKLLHYLRRMKQ